MIGGMAIGNGAQAAAVTCLDRPEQCIVRPVSSAASSPTQDAGVGMYCFDTATATVSQLPVSASDETRPVSFVFRKQLFQYDTRAFIRLHSPLHLRLEDGRLRIEEWDADTGPLGDDIARLGLNDALSSAILRVFQALFQAASGNALSAGQRRQWLKMLSTFDYRAFRAGLSHPAYEEGKVWSISGKAAVVVWEGGRRDVVPLRLSPPFANGRIREGDRIGAMVTRGERDAIAALDDIRLLPAQEEPVPWGKLETAGG